MSNICQLHDEAMLIMNKANANLQQQDIDACALFLLACEYEASAANLVEKKIENEPSRGMLYLGAASLAWRGKDYEHAERLIGEALSGYPPEYVKEDLRKLFDDVKFSAYAEASQTSLTAAEADIKIYGKNVGYGVVPVNLLLRRLSVIDGMVQRTNQRKNNQEFVKQPKKNNDFPQYETDIEWGKAGSFGLKIKLRQKNPVQLSLLREDISPKEILADVVENIQLVNEGKVEVLKEKIGDITYFENFMAHAKELAPDGERVEKLGFVIANKQVLLDKTRKNIVNEDFPAHEKEKATKLPTKGYITIQGWLRISDGVGGIFSIVSEDETQIYKVKVSEALDELARTYFGMHVEVTCKTVRNHLHLVDIALLED